MRFGFAIRFWGILLSIFALMALRLGMSSQHSAATAAYLGEVAFAPAASAAVSPPLFVGPPNSASTPKPLRGRLPPR